VSPAAQCHPGEGGSGGVCVKGLGGGVKGGGGGRAGSGGLGAGAGVYERSACPPRCGWVGGWVAEKNVSVNKQLGLQSLCCCSTADCDSWLLLAAPSTVAGCCSGRWQKKLKALNFL
jgi:hypothetical protein